MNKAPFVIIGILLLAAVFVVIFSRKDTDTPLAVLDGTPTPSTFIDINASPTASQTQISPSIQPTQAQDIVTNATEATITTGKGVINIKLYPQDAPKTVANFATLAKRGYYNGLTFHRVEPGFVIQGGDPKGNGTGGVSIYGETFEDELSPQTPSYKEGYIEGVLAMANRGPNTNGSQFFIMLADNTSLPHNYTIFGKVTKGMEVVKQIAVGDKMTSIDVQ